MGFSPDGVPKVVVIPMVQGQRSIPSMYHRRLLLIAGVGACAMLLLGVQLVRLTVVAAGLLVIGGGL